MKCPDGDSVATLSIPERGDGVCSVCHGGGVGGFLDELVDGLNPLEKDISSAITAVEMVNARPVVALAKSDSDE
ncbi:MAG: hypothetical protein A3G93_14220 [Nitrospinae bacterium RIFCSPLOWO2_12_FULL_45_22]|nr:MAG: hypothetical protein A3G93_14220 [Nitrospinae bacterium RIFCSPLOWO2_12_FULL_45_22]